VGKALARERAGHVLVFLPGVGEIGTCLDACAPLLDAQAVLGLPLYGELSLEAQHQAVRPSPGRKVIFATNVAESSVTIDGVTAVIDTGTARVAGYDAWSGLSTLRLRPISKASAEQRTGRAGRTQPGHCWRLYTQHDFEVRPAFDKPEVERLDLAEAVLTAARLGYAAPALPWLTAPPGVALEAAQELLVRLGALTSTFQITELGKELAALPAHPRQARLLLEAARTGLVHEGALLAALLAERDIRSERGPARESGPSDLLALAEAIDQGQVDRNPEGTWRALGLMPAAAHAVVRGAQQLERAVARRSRPSCNQGSPTQQLQKAILAGYPDRVAHRRSGTDAKRPEYVLASGGAATLSDRSVVWGAEWLVAVAAEVRTERGQSSARVNLASAIEPDWLLDVDSGDLKDENLLEWNVRLKRVEAVTRLSYGRLMLSESTTLAEPSVATSVLLAKHALAAGVGAFADPEKLDDWRARIALLRVVAPELQFPEVDDAFLRTALTAMCEGCHAFRELEEISLLGFLNQRLTREQRVAMDRWLPHEMTLSNGRRLKVVYDGQGGARLGSYLQDFFGCASAPALAEGRLPLTLELWAPNRRPVQVTRDLGSFWHNHYPALRQELMRKYPRHDWPEDPIRARPALPGGRKRRD